LDCGALFLVPLRHSWTSSFSWTLHLQTFHLPLRSMILSRRQLDLTMPDLLFRQHILRKGLSTSITYGTSPSLPWPSFWTSDYFPLFLFMTLWSFSWPYFGPFSFWTIHFSPFQGTVSLGLLLSLRLASIIWPSSLRSWPPFCLVFFFNLALSSLCFGTTSPISRLSRGGRLISRDIPEGSDLVLHHSSRSSSLGLPEFHCIPLWLDPFIWLCPFTLVAASFLLGSSVWPLSS